MSDQEYQQESTAAATAANSSGAPQVAQQNMQYVEETGRWTYTDDEGVSFEYDENLKAWFPMFNEQLIQAQQSAYGETVPDSFESVYAENARRQKRKKNDIDYTGSNATSLPVDHIGEDIDGSDFPPGLESIPGRGEGSDKQNKRQKHNNNNKGERKPKPISSVFVTGLPLDTDVDEVVDVFKKGGVFMEDEKGNPKIKLYTDKEGRRNGEGLVTYLRPESVALTVDLLDDTEYRPGVEKGRIRVQQAQFKEKERPAAPASLSEDRKKKVQKKYQKLEKKLDWFEDDENLVKADKWNKVCILKHMFTLQELEADPSLLLDLKEDIREECEKLGEVTNVIIYDHHPEGVVSVRFKDKESAILCVRMMSGRYFAGQKVVAEIYDGHSKYEVQKTKEELEEEEKQRLDRYARWLEAEEEKEKKGKQKTDDEADGDTEQTIAADAPTP
ncbi:hypothetical protein BC939DRAFT_454716 [Gamsiella multidivaricata]|uniref:uncharacterized protein n=1 Tax=Gamsiella multidivaricata TaxID=101098 RepID=UPI00221E6177|nr:uncharacterized protein BC939DRAFT_454716 [Gamsiella multidivaricata]KAI7821864.1 hypothetical protein BC939DRAFT_454716 [Gamsiella multidivaricata]